ncbi:hypothetical protein BDZ91DRAFT_413459 [Kalaharituber pfeilii]|nr:hypothetical protein BDZ91DRAFT_413459 [Kalaharituber pfeilii]
MAKVKWEIFEREGVMEIRKSLMEKIELIKLTLSSCEINLLHQTGKQVKQLMGKITRLENGVPTSLGYPWNFDYKPILFIDALDRRMPFPYELFFKWETFNNLLQVSFKDCPGMASITRGMFTVTNEADGAIIPRNKWQDIITPGMTVSMSIIVRLQTWRQFFLKRRCTSCGRVNQDYNSALKRVRCQGCGTWMMVSINGSNPRIQEVHTEQDAVPTNVDDVRDAANAPEVSMDLEDVTKFRRVHITFTRSPPPDIRGIRRARNRDLIKRLFHLRT